MRNAATTTMTRREKFREATLAEIMAIARGLLVAEGSSAVTISAIARKMGVSGPALYRYHSSQGELIEALRAHFFGELVGVLREAGEAGSADTPGRRLLSICRALRGWAVAHPAEFGWLFANRAPAFDHGRCVESPGQSGQAFGQVFLEQVVEIWESKRFPLPSLEDMDPRLAGQLLVYSDRIEGRLPPEAAYIFLSCWMRLYGLLCMEVLNQIGFAYSDLEPVFEECLQDLCRLLDTQYEPPAAATGA